MIFKKQGWKDKAHAASMLFAGSVKMFSIAKISSSAFQKKTIIFFSHTYLPPILYRIVFFKLAGDFWEISSLRRAFRDEIFSVWMGQR